MRLVELSEDGVGSLPARLLVARGDALADLGNDSAARVAYYDAMNRASPGSTDLLEHTARQVLTTKREAR